MFSKLVYYLSDNFLIYPFIAVFLVSVWVTIKSRFIQVRTLPLMIRMLLERPKPSAPGQETVSPRTALFVAMSTSIGIVNIVGPIVAIGMGGPGALAGFILATLFGASMTFTEVNMALTFRKKNSDGSFSGGPMQYLSQIFSDKISSFYAWAGFFLLTVWSANQANNLSVLLETKGIPKPITGLLVAAAITIILVGGIKRIGALSDRLVPFMFALYTFATVWVVGCNISKVPEIFWLMMRSLFSLQGVGGAGFGLGLQAALRWGFAKGMQANETGVGTSTFPHSASNTNSPYRQGVISMVSVFSNAFLCLMSGLTVMVSGAWLAPGATFDIRMFLKVMEQYFPGVGPGALIFCSFLFAFGTILGNCYNGSQCFLYVIDKGRIHVFHAICALAVFLGCISDVTLLWTIVDFFVLPVVIPNVIAILVLLYRGRVAFWESESV